MGSRGRGLILAAAAVAFVVTAGLTLDGIGAAAPDGGLQDARGVALLGGPIAGADGLSVTAAAPGGDTAGNGAVAQAILPTSSPAPIPSAALTTALGALRAKYGIPGMQAVIIWPDGRSWSAITGFANVAARVRVRQDTPFSVGSITKTFVAALVLELAEQGRLSLDDPVSRWLPTLPATKVPPGVTVRELLQHTSGVYDFFSNNLIDPALTSSKRRVWSFARDMLYVRTPYFPDGTGWAYSNTNYVVLGQIAQLAGGQSVPVQLRALFIGPKRLLSATYQVAESPRIPVAHAYTFNSGSVTARPIDQSDGSAVAPFTSVTSAAGSAGALAMSAWDLARWARALYGGRVLGPDSLAAMEDTTLTSSLGYRPYGLGLQETSVNGWPAIGHGGRLIGAQSAMRYIPDLGVSIAVTTNQWRTSPDVVVNALAEIALPTAPPPPPPPSPSPTPGPTPSFAPTPPAFLP